MSVLERKGEGAAVAAEFQERRGELLDLSEAQMKRIKGRLKRELEAWEEDTAELHARLERWNDLIENIVEETNFPFEGAANVHVPLVAIFAKVYHSIERRSILGADQIWYLESLDEGLAEVAPEVEGYLNFKARTVWNIKDALSQVFWTTNRDGLGILQVDYVIETEEVEDVVLVTGELDFLEEFPSADEAGLSAQEYRALQLQAMVASEEDPLELPIREEKVTYRGPRAEVVELINFVVLPATARSLRREDARGHGKRFYLRRGEIKRRMKAGEFYEEEGRRLLERRGGSEPTSYMRAQDYAQGLSRSGKSDLCCLFQLVYWFDLKRDGVEVKVVFTYSKEKDALVEARLYKYRSQNFVPFRIESRANVLIGNSIPWGLSDLNQEVDDQHNQRINSRTITQVPSFKAQLDLKGEFDPGALENQWRPGVIFWLRDFKGFEQFPVQPTDLGSSIQEEQNSLKYCSLWAGLDPFAFSGLPQADDPEAPGNKTIALIGQANLRMDDPLAELRVGVEELGRLCLSLEYQFGPAVLEFQGDGAGKKGRRTISKKHLRRDYLVNMHGTTVALNPETEFVKWMNIYRSLALEPVIGGNVKRRTEALRSALRNGRIHGRERILPSMEELEREEVEMKAMVLARSQRLQLEQGGAPAGGAAVQAEQKEGEARAAVADAKVHGARSTKMKNTIAVMKALKGLDDERKRRG